MEVKNKKRRLVGHGDYLRIVNCRTKIPAILRGMSEIFLRYSNFLLFIPRYVAEPERCSAEQWLGNNLMEQKYCDVSVLSILKTLLLDIK